jgi:hypothetical protein
MLDYALRQYLPGSIYNDRFFHCQVCGQKSVMLGDGFSMNRCMNCGRYQHAMDQVGMDFTWIYEKAASLWKLIKDRFAPTTRGELKVNFESGGGIQ